MPCFRGLELCLMLKPENERIPEYPHPEGSSVCLVGVHGFRPAASPRAVQSSRTSAGSSSTHSIAQSRKGNATISVYVPSVPGSSFAIKYHVKRSHFPSSNYMFFKLTVNGRPFASWGIDLRAMTEGSCARSLWQPGERWEDHVGYEGRSFVFLPGQEKRSVADDGGLIEVQAFRARDRKARAPRLGQFRPHDNYGIASPSNGLVEAPQDACFFDWLLVDYKDAPYATFRFHYRSWRNLEQLSLIPPTELAFLRSSMSGEVQAKMDATEQDGKSCRDSGDEEHMSSTTESSDGAVFTNHKARDDEAESLDSSDQGLSEYFLKTPPERFHVLPTKNNVVPQPSKVHRDAFRESYLQRPLPELPREEERSALSRRSSVASNRSGVPSLTPSLLEYVDDGSFEDDDMEVGVANFVQLPRAEAASTVTLRERNRQDSSPTAVSVSDYEVSPPSSAESGCKAISPDRYLPTTGAEYEQHIMAMFTPPKELSGQAGTQQSRPQEPRSSLEPSQLQTKQACDLQRSTRSQQPVPHLQSLHHQHFAHPPQPFYPYPQHQRSRHETLRRDPRPALSFSPTNIIASSAVCRRLPGCFSEQNLPRLGTVQLTESQWMSRTPSPPRPTRNHESGILHRIMAEARGAGDAPGHGQQHQPKDLPASPGRRKLWSPRQNRKSSGKSFFSGFRKRKSCGSENDWLKHVGSSGSYVDFRKVISKPFPLGTAESWI